MHDIIQAELDRLATTEQDLTSCVDEAQKQLEAAQALLTSQINDAYTELVGVRHSKATLLRLLDVPAEEMPTA